MTTTAPRNDMAAARAAKAEKERLLREKVAQLEEEKRRRNEPAPPMEQEMLEDSMEEESSDEIPPPTRKRKRERQLSVQPFRSVEEEQISSPEKKKPNTRTTTTPRDTPSWSQRSLNALYATAPYVGSSLLLFLGVVAHVATSMPVKNNTSFDSSPIRKESHDKPQNLPSPTYHVAPRDPDAYSLL